MSIILNGTTGITAPAGTLNRSGDGDIITLEKDGVYKGLIGINGNDPYFGRRAGVGITAQNNKIRPADGDDGSGYDNAVDLGEPTYRFKNLYLSGGVYVGGTGSANYLDDYEEGTFTPALEIGGSTSGITYSEQVGLYVKIGTFCYVQITISLSSKGSNSGVLTFNNLPFLSDNTTGARGGGTVNFFGQMSGVNGAPTVYGEQGTYRTGLYDAGNSIVALSQMDNTNLTNSTYMRITYVYQTNS